MPIFKKLRSKTKTIKVKSNLSAASLRRLLVVHDINIGNQADYLLSEICYASALEVPDFQVVFATGEDLGLKKTHRYEDLEIVAMEWGLLPASPAHIVQILSSVKELPEFNLAMRPLTCQSSKEQMLFKNLRGEKGGSQYITTVPATNLHIPDEVWAHVLVEE